MQLLQQKILTYSYTKEPRIYTEVPDNQGFYTKDPLGSYIEDPGFYLFKSSISHTKTTHTPTL